MKNIQIVLATLLALLVFACGNSEADMTPDEQDVPESEGDFTVWDGPVITFSKADGADPEVEANQDRIASSVWITRANGGGQIYNAFSESEADKNTSPAGTLWAVGEISDIANLTFRPFRAAVGRPKDIVGQNLVMKLVEEDAYFYVKITSWSQQNQGGFTYERASE
jgi:hypothetical protein